MGLARAGWVALLGAFAFVVAGCDLGGATAHGAEPRRAPARGWPDAIPGDVELPPSDGALRVVMFDAGHGAEGNTGNTSTYCVPEQDFTLALADDVAATLEETGRFRVLTVREGDRLVPYAERAALAHAQGAHAFVSLHSDIRGRRDPWSPRAGCASFRSEEAPGFSVLFSDEADDAALVASRRELAHATSDALALAGFLPYDGDEYVGLYAPEPGAPGAFVDRHAPDKRIFVLRRLAVPSILVETHNALDPREAERWEDPTVRRAFALALGRALATMPVPAR
jgi:N-acetylmuramoyl-L-alanine amidase